MIQLNRKWAITLALSILNTTAVVQFANAQVQSDSLTPIQAGVLTHQDERLVQIFESYQSYHEKHPEIPGYRIEIFSSSGANSKLKARSNRLKFTQEFDSIPAYVVWEYPNFEVRVGDYRTKLDAERALQAIIPSFPFAFITKDDIELPPIGLKEED